MTDVSKLLTVWDQEELIVDEHCHTPHAGFGWHAWNGSSPEVEFCEAAGRIAEGLDVIETGVGQGYTTRRVAATARSLTVFESWEPLRRAIRSVLPNGVIMSDRSTPLREDVRDAELCIFDSSRPYRPQEITTWWFHGHGLCLLHDTGNGHKPSADHMKTQELIRELGCGGYLYGNPRGSALLWHTPPNAELLGRVGLPILDTL